MLFRNLLALVPFVATVLAAGEEPVPADDIPAREAKSQFSTLNVTINSTFADAELVLKPTVLNRHISTVNVLVTNNEVAPVVIDIVGGSLWDIDRHGIIKNLSTHKVDARVEPQRTVRVPFTFNLDVHPQDARLEMGIVFTSATGQKQTMVAYNGTISVADPPTSLLDPQIIFLYLFILAGLGGVGFWAYNTWVVPMMPKKKRVPVREKQPVVAVTSSADLNPKGYDESWIPELHTRSQGQQKVRGTTPQRTKSSQRVD